MIPSIWRLGEISDPITELMRLRNEMNRLFSGATYPFQEVYPAVNIWMNESGAVVTAELPGVELDKVDISVLNDTVTIAGSREAESQEGKENYHRKERPAGKFTRTLRLPLRSAKRK